MGCRELSSDRRRSHQIVFRISTTRGFNPGICFAQLLNEIVIETLWWSCAVSEDNGCDTSFSLDTLLDAPLRTRRLLGRRVGFPSKAGRRLCQDLAPELHLAQLHQVLALDACQQIAPKRVNSRDFILVAPFFGLAASCKYMQAKGAATSPADMQLRLLEAGTPRPRCS